MTNIGIVSVGTFIPEKFMTSKEIAEKSGIPIEVVEAKLGIKSKPVASYEDHTCEMGIKAAQIALKKGDVAPEEIDLIIYIGEEHKEYPLWTAALYMQKHLGAVNAVGFDMALRCGTTIMGMKLAKDMMVADESIRTVLLAGGYRNEDFIDYTNPRTRFMYNLGAGGGAILLKKDYGRNTVLSSHLITDGSFSEDVVVVAGGTKYPISAEALELKRNKLDVLDPEGMKSRLEEKSMNNFLKVIRESLSKSGYTQEDVDYLGILHMKKSAHDYVLQELGLREHQSIYLENYGHIGQIDQILSLELALQQGRIKGGDIIVLVSAGIGYAWGATTIQWGKP
ncbi:3-oxoacyl-ACP synthase [Sutcliffiella horikoshii]|uniref:3-oxoacyl-ACP synthase n=1 Tax=Sutcliffiella horikoshii TaxID=79883 RepID=UPI001F47025B|nr:3-oxoacyl-ACP synthase [Sutcliffiella horikoshii]MCG1022399.1 3-oxoacyl-ACP synthase [Sutcliffiella horikoshii]